jgi:NAD(P)-dependent dehydrogenase (short-subunit alcohol dehydrogenase family)
MNNSRDSLSVVVTGAAQGIGKTIAARYAARGANVTIADINLATLEPTSQELKVYGVKTDVSSETEVNALVKLVLERYGKIDVLVNNAGFSDFKPLADQTLQEFMGVLSVNLVGAWLCARAAAPHLRASRGAIVNIASTRAIMSEPGGEAYAASKGGLVALTHALAVSLQPEVRVNCVSPGWIETRAPGTFTHSSQDQTQHLVGRVGTPEDIAATVMFLNSKDAGFITGQNVVVDGGMTKKMIYLE